MDNNQDFKPAPLSDIPKPPEIPAMPHVEPPQPSQIIPPSFENFPPSPPPQQPPLPQQPLPGSYPPPPPPLQQQGVYPPPPPPQPLQQQGSYPPPPPPQQPPMQGSYQPPQPPPGSYQPPLPQQQPPPPPHGYRPPQQMYSNDYPGKGQSTASMVLGIISLLTSGFIVTAVIGLILGIGGKKKASEVGAPTGMAQAGIIMNIIAIVLGLLITVACISCLTTLDSGFFDDLLYY